MQKLTRSLLFAGAVLGLAACGDDVSVAGPAPAVITGVTVSPASVSIAVGEKVVLSANVAVSQGSNPPVTTVTWSPANAAIATVSATGEVTGVAPGTTTIRATSTADPSKQGAAGVTVSTGVSAVTLAPQTAQLQIGGTLTAVASVQRANSSISSAVTWSTSAAGVATVDANGVITAVSAGTAVITATSVADPTKSASLSLTVVSVPNSLTALSVSPTQAGLGVGGTVQIVPNATVVGNAPVTYAYQTSNAAVATVDANGLVTAVGNGTAVITTTATTSTNSLSAATTITVASASVSISSITQANLPVNLANVGGQFEVTMNISAGNQTLDSVRVKLGGTSAATQTFTLNGAPNAPVTLSINSAAYILNPDSTATVRFPNGVTTVQAELFTQGSSGPSASNTIQITLNNLDTFHARWTLPTSATSPATSPSGLIWYGGPGTSTFINVVPVMYSGNTVKLASIILDDASVIGLASLCGTVVVDSVAPFTATYTCAGVWNMNVQPAVLSSIRTDGNPGPVGVAAVQQTTPLITLFANAAAITPVRIDVVGPTGFALAMPASPNNWFNSAFDFNSLVTVGTDPGVGLGPNAVAFQYADLPSTTWIPFTAGPPNNIPEDPIDFTNAAYAARLLVTDLLGNATTVPQSGATTFGIDNTGPEMQYSGGLIGTPAASNVMMPNKDSVLHNVTPNNQPLTSVNALFGVRIRDTRSGFDTLNQNYYYRKISRLFPVGQFAQTGCAEGLAPDCDFLTGIQLQVDPSDPTYRYHTIPVYGVSGGYTSTSAGYYTFFAYALDRAGNYSPQVNKQAAIDIVAPQVTGINFPASLPGASQVAFVPNGSDDLEVISGALYLTYPNMTGGPLRYSSFSNLDSPWNSTLATPVGNGAPFGSAGFTVPHGFLNGIDVVNAADSTPPVAVSGTYAPTLVGAQFYDIKHGVVSLAGASPDSSGVFNAGILPAQLQPGTPFSAVGVGQWYIQAAAGAAIQVRAKTATSITNPPFPQVAFFRLVGAVWQYIGTTVANAPTNPTLFDNGFDRFWTYTSPAVSPALTTGNLIRAVGMSAAGDGLSTVTFSVP